MNSIFQKFLILYQLITICFLIQFKQNDAFTNILGEFFNDLKFGKFDRDFLGQKIYPPKLKCLRGSHSFNGSCYFISNKKYLDSESERDVIIENLIKMYNKNKQFQSIQSTPIGTAAELAALPLDAIWSNANQYCSQLNNDSSLLSFIGNNEEYEYIIDLLKRLNFQIGNSQPDKNSFQEQKYFIGLTYNNSVWKWTNGINLSDFFIDKFQLNSLSYDKYRKCAYLSLRDNGDIKIELSNCFNDKQPYICKYVIDRCYNNTSCGKNGECVNIPWKKSFECRCRIFYDGKQCEKWSNQGIQMLIASGSVIFALAFLLGMNIYHKINNHLEDKKERLQREQDNYNRYYKAYKDTHKSSQQVMRPFLPRKSTRFSFQPLEANIFKLIFDLIRKKIKLFLLLTISFVSSILVILAITFTRSKIIQERIQRYKENSEKQHESLNENIDKDNASKLTTFFSFDVCKLMNDQFLEDYILIFFSLSLTAVIYFWNAFKCNKNHEYFCQYSAYRIKYCGKSDSSVNESEVSVQSSVSSVDTKKTRNPILNFISRILSRKSLRKFTFCGFRCTCGIEFPIPMNPFSKRNRFLTGIIYAAYTYNILKIFEFLLIGDQNLQAIEQGKNLLKNSSQYLNLDIAKNLSLSSVNQHVLGTFHNATESFKRFTERGILMDLLKQICNVFIMGLRYYPVLLCIDLKRKSKFSYFLCTLYVSFLLVYYIYMNTFCLLSAYTTIKDAQNSISKGRPNFEIFNPTDSNDVLQRAKSLPIRPKSSVNDTRNSLYDIHTTRYAIFKNKSRFQRELIRGTNYYEKSQMKVNDKADSFLNKSMDLKNNAVDDFLNMNNKLFWNNLMYEKFLFYAVLFLITLNMIVEFSKLIQKWLKAMRQKKNKDKRKCSCCKKKLESEQNDESGDEIDESDEEEHEYLVGKYKNELKYTAELFKKKKPPSYLRDKIERYIYQNRRYFRFSKQFINTNTIAFILLYYITCTIIRKSNLIVSLSSNLLIMMINFIFKMGSATENPILIASKTQLNSLINSLYDNINIYIIIACSFTSFIYVIQLILGIRSYHKHVLNGYRGVYVDIPSPRKFSNLKLTSSSLHYSGYAIGYLLWGYLILFEVSIVMIIIIKFLIKFYIITENLAKVFLPIITIYLFKRIFIWYVCSYFVTGTSKSQSGSILKNRKFYFILNHFNFFFDCFLGSFVCFMRMANSSLAALFFMPRLDYSIYGRFLENKDMGFISYVTFIHMEVIQTHPVKLAFCEILKKTQYELCENNKYSKTMRNKWFVAYTLIKNPIIKKERKGYIYYHSLIPKVESFEHFLKRQKVRFFDENIKKKSKSTPCLIDDGNIYEKKVDVKTSTIDSRVVPPIPPKRNRLINYNYSSTETYNPNLDSSDSTENTTLNFNQNPHINSQTAFKNDSSLRPYFQNRRI